MTTITNTTLTLPTSGQLSENPLPMFQWQQPMPLCDAPPVGLSPEEVEGYVALGEVSILPYHVQEGYDLALTDQDHQAIVIENAFLRATILPELGGRLYSLWDKKAGRELLFCNPVIRFANLALRDAWFSGGIEWNGGSVPGHTPSTCDPIFAHRVDTERGPILRLHDFDRISETAWQIDLFLPEGSARLFIHGTIINPNQTPRDVYWWTNASVTNEPGLRVLSPADYGIEHVLPDNHLEPFPFPQRMGFDGSYPQNWRSATSVFFRKPGQVQPWLAACRADGSGLAQVSTADLRGRKFFYFGTGQGGQHWLDFLSQPGKGDYVEIQSGLMPTQNQRFSLDAGDSVGWTECFMPIVVPEAGDPDYVKALRGVAGAIHAELPPQSLSEVDRFLGQAAFLPVTETLCSGPGWGALHEMLMAKKISSGMEYGASLEESAPWDRLAADGKLMNARDMPDSFVFSATWRDALDRADCDGNSRWLRFLTLGLMALNDGDFGGAAARLEASIAARTNWMGHRCLAVIEAKNGNFVRAAEHYTLACNFDAAPQELYLEFAAYQIENGDHGGASATLNHKGITSESSEAGRVLRAKIALASGDLHQLEDLLDHDFAYVREGETTLTDLWEGLVLERTKVRLKRELTDEESALALDQNPIPKRLNFSLQTEVSKELKT